VLALFVLTACAGVVVAYNPGAAWAKWVLVVAAVLVYALLYRLPEQARTGTGREIEPLRWALILFPALVVLFFLFTNHWTDRIGKLPWLDPVVRALAQGQPDWSAIRLGANAYGGLLAAALPLQWIACRGLPRRVGLPLLGLTALGLLLSESRGAWFALGFSGLVWIVWRSRGAARRLLRLEWLGRINPLPVALALGLMLAALVTLTPLGERLLALQSDRAEVWHNSLDLAQDYALTGVGLGNVEMAYSSYVLLVHVGHTTHAHNLFLDIWLEQGLPGLITFALLVALALLRGNLFEGTPSVWATGAWFAILVIVMHGLLDDAFYGYGGRATPFLLAPFALLFRFAPLRVQGAVKRLLAAPAVWVAPVALVIVLVGVVWLWPPARAQAVANEGALVQTRAELSRYQWPQWPIQDALRRQMPDILALAQALYQDALRLDMTNSTANRRLGQIELSLGQYEQGCKHIQSAFAAAPMQRATRQLLGECYALAGDAAQAAQLWSTLVLSAGELDVRIWWYKEYLACASCAERMTLASAAMGPVQRAP
jgi:hypothetical protein